jgi:hypothetical protein
MVLDSCFHETRFSTPALHVFMFTNRYHCQSVRFSQWLFIHIRERMIRLWHGVLRVGRESFLSTTVTFTKYEHKTETGVNVLLIRG